MDFNLDIVLVYMFVIFVEFCLNVVIIYKSCFKMKKKLTNYDTYGIIFVKYRNYVNYLIIIHCHFYSFSS